MPLDTSHCLIELSVTLSSFDEGFVALAAPQEQYLLRCSLGECAESTPIQRIMIRFYKLLARVVRSG